MPLRGDSDPDVAVLFAERYGSYFRALLGVDLWHEERDARTYAGDLPVVAHPPCARWCRLAGLVEARWGHKRGEDGGCFASALASVRRCGGVLEHPAFSDAFYAFDLPIPDYDGWTEPDEHGGSSCYVDQSNYGHRARKATWLYAVRCDLPDLIWGRDPRTPEVMVSGAYAVDQRPRIFKKAAASTPIAFRDVLLAMARSVTLRPWPLPASSSSSGPL